jgi:Phospholipase_D-nuclease N-terminal
VIRALPELIELALLVYCLIDCIQSPEAEIRNLPRWGWLILIILVPIIGSVAWLVAGRPQRVAGAQRRTPWAARTGGYPDRERPALGPDDDASFLHDLSSGLKRADDEHEDVLRQWEEDLRRREEQLKRGDEEPPPVTT